MSKNEDPFKYINWVTVKNLDNYSIMKRANTPESSVGCSPIKAFKVIQDDSQYKKNNQSADAEVI